MRSFLELIYLNTSENNHAELHIYGSPNSGSKLQYFNMGFISVVLTTETSFKNNISNLWHTVGNVSGKHRRLNFFEAFATSSDLNF